MPAILPPIQPPPIISTSFCSRTAPTSRMNISTSTGICFQFSDVFARLGEAKLSFVYSGTLVENIDAYAVPPALTTLVAAGASEAL